MIEAVATGRFSVTMTPEGGVDPAIGSMKLDKSYAGDLVAAGAGQMLAVRSPVEGSAGYVAIERITGSLHGRSGSFTLQHHGLMDRGAPALSVVVIPDSGTDGLSGLTGRLEIDLRDGAHFYSFAYTLPD
jgi:hypothetical protein